MPSMLLTCAALFGVAAHALVAGPMKTFQPRLPFNAVSPAPTAAPVVHDELLHILLNKKQVSSGTTTVLFAPDNTCGYASGVSAVPFTCSTGRTCALFTSQLGVNGFVGCCNDVNCGSRTTCFDSSSQAAGTSCDSACLANTHIVKCTDSTAPFCLSISFSGQVTDFFCGSFTNTGIVEAQTTFKGQTRSFRTVELANPTSSSSSRPVSSASISTGGVATVTITATPTPSNHSDNNTTPVGNIVGGVVGGVVVTILLILLVCWYIRRKKNKFSFCIGAFKRSQPKHAKGKPNQHPQQGYAQP